MLNCSQDNPLIDPNPQTKYVLILSEGAKYCIIPINAPANPAIIKPIMTKEVEDLTRKESEITKNKAMIAPIKEATMVIQGLLRNSSKPIIEKRKITMATPKLAIDVIPKTEGSANGFLNNSCIRKPEIGNEIPTKRAVNDFGKRKLSTRLWSISSEFPESTLKISVKEIETLPTLKLKIKRRSVRMISIKNSGFSFIKTKIENLIIS